MFCTLISPEKTGSNAVPIVFGPLKQDVLDVAPIGSFIHSEDFDSAYDLVKYLDYLDKNDTAYLEYHQWVVVFICIPIITLSFQRKAEPDLTKTYPSRILCDLCKEVKARKAAGFPKRTIKSVASYWWINVHDNQCTSGKTIPSWLNFPPVKMNETYDEFRSIRDNFIGENDILH